MNTTRPRRGHLTPFRRAVALAMAAALPSMLTVAATASPARPAAASPMSVAVTQTASSCALVWGSLPKASGSLGTGTVSAVRAGQHSCFDRLVIDVQGRISGYAVRYVPVATYPGSGAGVPLAGAADLQIVAMVWAADAQGRPTYRPTDALHAVSVSGFSTFRQVAWLGTYEGYSDLGLGVRARLPFRVFLLAGPGSGSRLVIDVAHHW